MSGLDAGPDGLEPVALDLQRRLRVPGLEPRRADIAVAEGQCLGNLNPPLPSVTWKLGSPSVKLLNRTPIAAPSFARSEPSPSKCSPPASSDARLTLNAR